MPFAICSLGPQASGLRTAGVKIELWDFCLINLEFNSSVLLCVHVRENKQKGTETK